MCSRAFLSNGKLSNSPCLTGRNMDWNMTFNTNLWAFPAGVVRESAPKSYDGRFTWTSDYKSVASVITQKTEGERHIATTIDGINEKGLAVNALWMSESNYGIPQKGDKVISIKMWVQYMLDNYFSVKDAVQDWMHNKYCITTELLPEEVGNKYDFITNHLAISDEYGNSAIFEYYQVTPDAPTKLHITTNIEEYKSTQFATVRYEPDCSVMTNSPTYEKQLKINYYWKWIWEREEMESERKANEIAKLHSLPGTNTPVDRFIRLSHYVHYLEKKDNYTSWVGQMFGLMKTASVPIGYVRSKVAHTSNTIWSSVADHKLRRYYFQTAKSPSLVWINLDELDLNDSKTLLYYPIEEKLQAEGREELEEEFYMGNITQKMERKDINDFLVFEDDAVLVSDSSPTGEKEFSNAYINN